MNRTGAPARAEKGNVVHTRGKVRQQVGDLDARLTVFLEHAGAGEQGRIALGELAGIIAEAGRQRLAVPLRQFGLGVEQVDVAGPAEHEEEDDRLGLPLEVTGLGGERIVRRSSGYWRRSRRCAEAVAGQQPVQGRDARKPPPAFSRKSRREVASGKWGSVVGGVMLIMLD